LEEGDTMRLRRSRWIYGLAVVTGAAGLLLVALAAAQPAPDSVQTEADWLPVGAQAFSFGEDGRAIVPEADGPGGTRGWAFYGPTGKCDVVVSGIRREWLAALADAASLTEPPKQRRLAIVLHLSFEPGGGGRWRYGRARVEVGLVDDEGRVTMRLEGHTGAARAMCISFPEYSIERLLLTLPELPDKLSGRGYIRADVVAASTFEPADLLWPPPGSWYDY
jgi:hypothetical protein